MFCLYVFYDENKLPFYVGKTNNFIKRMKRHLWEIKKSKYPNHLKLKKVLSLGIKPEDIIIKIKEGAILIDHYD